MGVKPGDRDTASGPGGYAEQALADIGRVLPVPPRITAWGRQRCRSHWRPVVNGRLARGESVLMLGASAGVGLIGMQVAKFIGAVCVIGTSTDTARRARLAEFGADLALDTRDPAWPDAVLAAATSRRVGSTRWPSPAA